MNEEPRLHPDSPRTAAPTPATAGVTVCAPGRLHLGFIDLGASLGRRFGSLGLTLEGLGTQVRAEFADAWSTAGIEQGRTLAFLHGLADTWALGTPIRLTVSEAPPAHAGLGSGTQLALAVGAAVARLCRREAGPADIAALLGRGARSGIGIGAFEAGGFLVDGGRACADGRPPPVVSRLEVPAHWRVILMADDRHRGLHGQAELRAFAELPPFPETAAAHLAHRVLMQILPALAEADLTAFGEGISTVQRIVGDHFAPAQGGRYASPRVAAAIAWLETAGVAGRGQSSWGPTGFALAASEAEAQHLVTELQRRFGGNDGLRFSSHAPRNRGASFHTVSAAAAASSADAAAPALRLAASR